MDAALTSGEPGDLRDWLRGHGVDLHYVPDSPEVDQRAALIAAPVELVSVVTPVTGKGTMFCVVPTDVSPAAAAASGTG